MKNLHLEEPSITKNLEPKVSKEESFTKSQTTLGIFILITFLIFRFLIAQIWITFFDFEYHFTIEFILFLLGSFILVSVILIGFGFEYGLKINLKKLWIKKGKIAGDIGWGLLALIVLLIVSGFFSFIGGILGLVPPTIETEFNPIQILTDLLLGLFFGFFIASFTEETLFRGFLQKLLLQKIKPRYANLCQALIFSISHFGIDINTTWEGLLFLLIMRFVIGIILGLLVQHRGNLLSAGIAHGILG